MKPIRVNVDFEEVLAGKPPRPSLRASVEFLALWLEARPLLASRNYSHDYLEYVARHTDHRPAVVSQGDAENWWGDLSDPKLMRSLSSKTQFLAWWQKRWSLEAYVCHSWNELEKAVGDGAWLVKKSDGMSGRGHLKLTRDELPANRSKLESSFSQGVVVEPLYERTRDISALWVPEEMRFIYYANEIDSRFQWRGAIIRSDLLDAPPAYADDWARHLNDLQSHVASLGYSGPFSVDAFFYLKEGKELFHPGSEMNPRKTMGWVNYQLWKKHAPKFATLSLISKVLKENEWQRCSKQEDVSLMSPPDCPFIWYWIEADDEISLENKRREFLKELPEVPGRGKA